MKVYVVGAGAVGTYLGELLRGIGNDVVYAPRELAAVEPVAADLAIVAVKAYATGDAIATLQRALAGTPGTTIVTPQNGIGNEERLAAAFGADAILACALTVPVDRDAGGRPVAANRGGVAFAPLTATSAHNWVLAAFGATGIEVRAASDYRALKWSKLTLNIIANAACAVLDVLPDRLLADRAAFELELRALREVRAVMRALGIATIDLPRYPVRALQALAALPAPLAIRLLGPRIAGARGGKAPSLLLDLRAGKGRSEVEFLNGAVARAALASGIPAPVNTVLARLVAEIAAAPARWDAYRGQPAALVAAVRAEAATGPA